MMEHGIGMISMSQLCREMLSKIANISVFLLLTLICITSTLPVNTTKNGTTFHAHLLRSAEYLGLYLPDLLVCNYKSSKICMYVYSYRVQCDGMHENLTICICFAMKK